jgi:hypothetical protein
VQVETSALPTGGDKRAEAQAREAQNPSGPLETRLAEDRRAAQQDGQRSNGQQSNAPAMSRDEMAKLAAVAREGVASPAEGATRSDRQLEPAGQAGRTPGAQHQRDTERGRDPQGRDR